MMDLKRKLKGTLFFFTIAASFSALADSYCPQTIDCKVSGGIANCNLSDGWVVGGVSYSGKTDPEISLNFFSAQSYFESASPSSSCNYYYSDPANANNTYNIFLYNFKWFTPPLPAGKWQQDVYMGKPYYWCYSKFVNPTQPTQNDAGACPFVVVAPK